MARRSAGSAAPTEPGPQHRLMLLVGPELFLHAEHTERLREKLREAHGDVDTIRFDGAAADPAAVLDECRTFGLMQQHKLVVVDNADEWVKSKEDEEGAQAPRHGAPSKRVIVERYAESPCESATLVLLAESWRKGNLDKLIEKNGIIVPCEPPRPDAAVRWCIRRCEKRHAATIEQAAAELLVERVGADLSRLDGELEKLALNAGEAKVITPAAVADMVGRSREEEVWVIQSALLTGDPQVAVAAVRDALDVSRHPVNLVIWACVDLARKVHGACRGLAAGEKTFELMKTLKIWGAGGDRVFDAARRLRPEAASDLLRDAVEADAKSKSGSDPEWLAERLALRFARV